MRTFVNVTEITLTSISPLDFGLFCPEFSSHVGFSGTELSLLVRDYYLLHSIKHLLYIGHSVT